MTKLVVVLAVVVVVILVVVIVAVRNMRSEDPDEFADRPGRRGAARDNRDGRDPRYDRREPAARHPGRGSARGGRPSGSGSRPAAGGFDERADRRARDYDQEPEDELGYDDGRRFDERPARGRDDRRGAPAAPRAEDRRRPAGRGVNGAQRRPEDGQPAARARSARGRRSDDSSQWDSSEWEKLSDVDYWAELASDKPLTTTAQPAAAPAARPAAPPRNGRSRPDREAEVPAGRGGPADPLPAGQVPAGAPRRDPVTGLPVRGRPQPAAGDRADFAAAPVPVNGTQQHLRPPAEPGPASVRHSGPASLPRPVHSLQRDRPPVDDDDPLTSPSFPRVPASDSRSYRNGRASAAPRGSRPPEQYLDPTQQFSSYGNPAPQPPAPQRPAAPRQTGPQRPPAPQRPAAQHLPDETGRTNPNAYRPDPLASRDPYPPRSASVPPAAARPERAAASNPYGSYVTPDSPPAVPGYGDYAPVPGNGHGSYPPPAAPAGGRPAADDYWQQAPAPGGYPGPDGSGYVNGSDPRHAGSRAADYGNGYGQHSRAGYPPNDYPAAGPHEPAGYAPADPYEPDEYGGYPGYGAADR
jgi:hypothetical protein